MKVVACHRSSLLPSTDGAAGDFALGGDVCASRVGGLAVYLVETLNGLRERGLQMSSVEFDPDACPAETRLSEDSYRLRGFRYRFRDDTFSAFVRILESLRPDVVHLHALFYEMHPRMMQWLLRGPWAVVFSLHDVGPVCFRGTRVDRHGRACARKVGLGCVTCGCYRPGEQDSFATGVLRVLWDGRYLAGYRGCDRVIVPSEYMRGLLLDHGFDDSRIETVPLFTRFDHEAAVDEDGAPDRRERETDSPHVLFVGRLDAHKGVEQFVEAMALLRDQEPWTATVVGDGPTRSRAEALAAQLGLGGRMNFAGVAAGAALADHYRRCDLLVFSSVIPESFGLVGVEAMTFAKPIVAFPSGGVTQWLEAGVTGLFAPHGDVERLAEQVARLLRDRFLRRRLGLAGREAVAKSFTLRRHLDRLEAIYEELATHAGREAGAPRAVAEVLA